MWGAQFPRSLSVVLTGIRRGVYLLTRQEFNKEMMMKVERVGMFQPIVITLETKDEVLLLRDLIQSRIQCASTAQAMIAREILVKIKEVS
jgi:hypothetical protein